MIIIPARLKSSRFENKILAEIDGLPMVIRTARRVEGIDEVCIATDSQEVLDIAKEHGFKAVMTGLQHQSGTDRINEAALLLGLGEEEIVINVQADEPYIEREVVQKVVEATKKISGTDIGMVSCYKMISGAEASDPNHVKVVVDELGNALYFSRAKIPFHRDGEEGSEYKGHLGIYGFTAGKLREFCSKEETYLEKSEKLEQLRALSNGKKISMVEVDSNSFGIDTKEDLEKLKTMINRGEIV